MRLFRGLIVAGLFVGCVYKTDRTQDLKDGEIHGTATRDDGSPAQGAVIQVAGSDRVTAADASGNFVVRSLVPGTWLLHVTEDDQGDGVAERAAWVPVTTRFVPIPKNLTDGCSGEPPPAVTSFLLGPVALVATKHAKGTVDLGAVPAGSAARVVVWRDIDFDGAPHASPIEGAAGVAADGSFDVGGLAPGAVHVAAFTFDPVTDPTASKALTFGVADAEAGGADVAVSADQPARTDADPTKLRTTPVQIDAQWNTPKTQSVQLSLATFLAPNTQATVHDADQTGWALDDQARAFVLDAPIGVVDIAFESATDGAAGGTLRGVVVVPDVAVLGPMELPVLADACQEGTGADVKRDCDHDGRVGLDVPDSPDVIAQYGDCAADCKDAFGPGGAGAVCAATGSDCDDDGDGQPDVTEPAGCIGPGLGTDLDGDGLCEPAGDPFPFCTDNDPLTCPQAFAKPEAQYP